MITIHKEGTKTIVFSFLIYAFTLAILALFSGPLLVGTVLLTPVLLIVILFFRIPHRAMTFDDKLIIAPADGKVVVIEPTNEPEVLKDERLQVSVFMSPFNVHVNRYPINGEVEIAIHHSGRKLPAFLPKASTENERTTVVIKTAHGEKILMRQIAGSLARRIVCYSETNKNATQNAEMGFIKFGSRVDLMLPLGTEILVKPGEKVKGGITPIARLK